MKKAIAVILLLIFVPLFIIITLYLSTSTTILNAKLITQKLAANNVYSTITEEMIPQFVSTLTAQEGMKKLDETAEQTIETMSENIQENINTQWLQTEFEKLYQNFTDYLKGTQVSKEIVIDLSPISNALSTSSLLQATMSDDFLRSQYKSLPVCKESQNTNCRSDDSTFEAFKQEVEKEMDGFKEQSTIKNDQPKQEIIPESINVYESLTIKDESSPSFGQNMLDKGKNTLKNVNTAAYVFIAVLAIIVVVIVLMFLRKPSQMMKFLGIGFLVTSILMFLFSALGFFTSPIINGLLQAGNVDLANIGPALIPFIGSVVGAITLKITITAVLLLIVAIVLLILAKKYKGNNKY